MFVGYLRCPNKRAEWELPHKQTAEVTPMQALTLSGAMFLAEDSRGTVVEVAKGATATWCNNDWSAGIFHNQRRSKTVIKVTPDGRVFPFGKPMPIEVL